MHYLRRYRGEIGFFDFYIIPLAKKLKECGVFGVSSDEYLHFAEANRREWEEKGETVVKELVEKYRNLHPTRKVDQLLVEEDGLDDSVVASKEVSV